MDDLITLVVQEENVLIQITPPVEYPITIGGWGAMGYSGYSGYDARAGYTGVSGYSGYDARAGYSGDSGESGYSGIGTSGYSGISGLSGYSSDSGYSGYSSVSGYSGKSGYSGYSGIGTSGYSGIGTSGYSGQSFVGSSGYSGYSSDSGYSGKSGYSGFVNVAESLRAYATTAQTVKKLIWTKVTIDTVSFGPVDFVDATHHRIQPTIAGYYQINGQVTFNPEITGNAIIALFKGQAGTWDVVQGSDNNYYVCIKDHTSSSDNEPITGPEWASYWVTADAGDTGSAWQSGVSYIGNPVVYSRGMQLSTSVNGLNVSDIIHCNGTTDYIELWIYQGSDSDTYLYVGYSECNFLSLGGVASKGYCGFSGYSRT